jgi:hypothetical protein
VVSSQDRVTYVSEREVWALLHLSAPVREAGRAFQKVPSHLQQGPHLYAYLGLGDSEYEC